LGRNRYYQDKVVLPVILFVSNKLLLIMWPCYIFITKGRELCVEEKGIDSSTDGGIRFWHWGNGNGFL